jgi:hypothetical protein
MNTKTQQQDPQNLDTTTPTRPDITRKFETVAGELAGVAERSGAWVRDQIHSGLSEFVSMTLLGRAGKTPEPEKDKGQEPDQGRDR